MKFQNMPQLSDVDLHLYLAKAMPWHRRLFFRVAIFLNDDLSERLQEMQKEISAYQSVEQGRLGYKLYADSNLNGPFPGKGHQRTRTLNPRWRMAMSAAFSVLIALAIWPLYQSNALKVDGMEEPLYTAKGSPLELSLFVKGDTLRRVQGNQVRIAPHDTLQLLPPGGAKPFVAIYGFEPGQGFTRLFPAQGNRAKQITSHQPPPGLVISGGRENRLLCIAQEKDFSLLDLEASLQKSGMGDSYPNENQAHILPAPWHLQTFIVQGEP